jgi:uncharacterized protein YdeI (BOF family)
MSSQFAKQRIIKDISIDDERIQVTGYIKSRINDKKIILDDKTGEITVNLTNIDIFNFKENDLVNVIGDLEFYQKLYQIKKDLN